MKLFMLQSVVFLVNVCQENEYSVDSPKISSARPAPRATMRPTIMSFEPRSRSAGPVVSIYRQL